NAGNGSTFTGSYVQTDSVRFGTRSFLACRQGSCPCRAIFRKPSDSRTMPGRLDTCELEPYLNYPEVLRSQAKVYARPDCGQSVQVQSQRPRIGHTPACLAMQNTHRPALRPISDTAAHIGNGAPCGARERGVCTSIQGLPRAPV